jgi:hypothetical protein
MQAMPTANCNITKERERERQRQRQRGVDKRFNFPSNQLLCCVGIDRNRNSLVTINVENTDIYKRSLPMQRENQHNSYN